jgi:TonB family protein
MVNLGRTKGKSCCWSWNLRNQPNQARLQSRIAPTRPLFAAFCLAAILSLALPAGAQSKTTRKLVYKEAPTYPLTLREAHIGGTVRLEIVISPKGSVDSVSPLGGNPVLVEAATSAVKKWKYVPADGETKTQVEFTFDPKH